MYFSTFDALFLIWLNPCNGRDWVIGDLRSAAGAAQWHGGTSAWRR